MLAAFLLGRAVSPAHICWCSGPLLFHDALGHERVDVRLAEQNAAVELDMGQTLAHKLLNDGPADFQIFLKLGLGQILGFHAPGMIAPDQPPGQRKSLTSAFYGI